MIANNNFEVFLLVILGILLGICFGICMADIPNRDVITNDVLDEVCVELYGENWVYKEQFAVAPKFVCEKDFTSKYVKTITGDE